MKYLTAGWLLLAIAPAFADQASCIANGKSSGNFFSGHTYTATENFPDIPEAVTFRRLNLYVLKDGWHITQADKDLGILSAAGNVALSSGSQTTLNITVEPLGKTGSTASATFANSSLQITTGEPMENLCKLLNGTPQ